jgi:serine protease Do
MAAWSVVLLALQVGAGPLPAALAASPTLYTEARPAAAMEAPTVAGLPDLTHLAASSLPAVVGLITSQPAGPADGDAVRELYDRLHEGGVRKGVGSGFIIHPDGWVVTNAHVVEGTDKVVAEVGERNAHLPARVIGLDAETDLALLKIDADRPLPYLRLGDSDRLQPAQWVVVIGCPFGLDHSVSLGIVSHTGRTDISPVGRPGTYDFIQTDASINPGSSGGPLIDLKGDVVGIAAAVNATGHGIGFAIPVNMAKAVIDQLHANGRVVRSWLGVSVKQLPARLDDSSPGVEVTEVAAGGPAQRAGVRSGDIITTIQGHAIENPVRLRWYVSMAGVGKEVAVSVRHQGEADRTLRVVLSRAPASEEAKEESRGSLGE